MKDTIFREYDIRGVVGTELLLEEGTNLGKAIATFFHRSKTPTKQVIIGKDGRSHSDTLTKNLIKGITDLGIDVIDIGTVPTPVMYFAIHHLKISAGLIITASHNPKQYNGIKFWGIWGQQIQEIKKIYQDASFAPATTPRGSILTNNTIVKEYINFLCNHFQHLKNISLNTVFDCGNGAAGIVLPELIHRMGWKNIKILFPEVDGNFPNHEADPTVIENMTCVQKELSLNPSFTLGIGFDGDCDRMNPMIKSGQLVPGDKLLAVFTKQILQHHDNVKVIFDIKASSGPMALVEKWGALPILSPSGHSLIKEAIKKHNATLGGELSCHFFFNDRYFGYDDAFYAALRLIEILWQEQKDLSELLAICPQRYNSPEIRIACISDKQKFEIVEHVKKELLDKSDAKLITIDGVRAETTYGWGLIRASNTQPVICLRFESNTSEGMKHIQKDFQKILKPYFNSRQLESDAY